MSLREVLTTPLRSLGSAFNEIFMDSTASRLFYDDRKVRYPWQYGAVGDGTTDDTTAIQAWITAARGGAGVGVVHNADFILDGGNRTYKVTSQILVNGLWNATIRNLKLTLAATVAGSVLKFDGFYKGVVSDVYINSTSTSFTATYGISFDWIDYGQSSKNELRGVTVQNLKCVEGISIGPNSAAAQVSEFTLVNCLSVGAFALGEATWYQKGIGVGSGTSGNILNVNCVGCCVAVWRYDLWVSAVNVVFSHGTFGGPSDANVYYAGAAHLKIEGVRTESSARFLETPATANVGMCELDSITWQGNSTNADGYWILWGCAGVLSLKNIVLNDVAASPNQIRLSNNAVTKTLLVDGYRAPFTPQTSYSAAGTFYAEWKGYVQVDGSTGLTTAVFPHLSYGETPRQWFVGTSAPDVSLYRKTATGYLFSNVNLSSDHGFVGWDIAATSSQMFRSRIISEAVDRFRILGNGKQEWGDGTNATDTNFYRNGADILKTDDALVVTDALTIKTKAGVPADGDFLHTPPDGTLCLDTSNHRIYLRDGGAWKYAALT